MLPVVLLTFFVGSSIAAISGIADFEPYEGLQPELVKGVEGGLVTGKPVVRHAFLVAPDVIGITIDSYGYQRNSPVDYLPADGDKVELFGALVPEQLWDVMGLTPFVSDEEIEKGVAGQFKFVYRDNEPLGHLLGADNSQMWPVEQRFGEGLDWAQLDRAQNYRTSLKQNSGESFFPEKIYRKTKPHGKANAGPGYAFSFGFQHQLYLRYPSALPVGEEISIGMPSLNLKQTTITIHLDTNHLRTEAIQVNQNGYEVSQSRKIAKLSTWMGAEGSIDYDWVNSFEVLDASNDEVVYRSKPIPVSNPATAEFRTEGGVERNLSRTSVYELDFSEMDAKEGMYYIRVPMLGISFDFPIKAGVWDHAARTQMLGYYHQRSGTSLGLPASDWTRPINFHPSMKTVHDVDRNKYFDRSAYSDSDWNAYNPFVRLADTLILESSLDNVWGGWADAADYDRNRHHLRAVQAMLFLFELNPSFCEQWHLQLPTDEATNAIPDILDEALWCTELFRRSQLPNGEVIEGVESIEHPNRGESSWRDSLPLAIKPGTPSMAVYWAGVAARISVAIAPYSPELAQEYEQSAMLALEWEQSVRNDHRYRDFQASDLEWMNASVFMLALTGDSVWNETFVTHWNKAFANAPKSLSLSDPYSVLAYVFLNEDLVDSDTQNLLRESVLSMGNQLVDGMHETAARILRPKGRDTNFQLVEALGSEYLIASHILTKKSKYLETLLQCSDFALGVNPMNLVFTTGLGERFIEPFYLDSEYTDKPFPTGIPAYGPTMIPAPLPEKAWGWSKDRAAYYAEYLHPESIHNWPLSELYFRYVGYPAMNEYTVHQGMREQLTRWAYLAQVFSDKQ